MSEYKIQFILEDGLFRRQTKNIVTDAVSSAELAAKSAAFLLALGPATTAVPVIIRETIELKGEDAGTGSGNNDEGLILSFRHVDATKPTKTFRLGAPVYTLDAVGNPVIGGVITTLANSYLDVTGLADEGYFLATAKIEKP